MAAGKQQKHTVFWVLLLMREFITWGTHKDWSNIYFKRRNVEIAKSQKISKVFNPQKSFPGPLANCRVTQKPGNIPFYRYGGHIEFIRFKKHHGMPRGHSLSIYAGFRAKRELHCIFHGKRRSLLYANVAQRSLFFFITFLFQENLKKNWPKKRE